MVAKPALIALCLSLSACAGYVEKAKFVTDEAAKATLQAPCAITLGAFVRLPQIQHDVVKDYAEVVCP